MKAEFFISTLKHEGIDSYFGVPDSLLKSICAYITDHSDGKHHVISANEGNAIGLACGHYLATARPAMVYMQNSGQGNCVNPLLSLMDEEVYSIPVLLLIGWRGEPGVKDEPQHVKQGKLTLPLLETMGIAYSVLSTNEAEADKQIRTACTYMRQHSKPYALIARKNTFAPYTLQNKRPNLAQMSREEAICTVASMLAKDDMVISTTGQISRELYEYRERSSRSHQADFLTVGAMGHASSIAMGVALSKPERRVICMDGDGAMLMHLGAIGIIGNARLPNLRHIVFNNAAHDSVGAQPTVADKLDINELALACGYSNCFKADNKEELRHILPQFLAGSGTTLLEITVACGARSDLARPKEKPIENKLAFMHFSEEGKGYVYPGALGELSRIITTRGWKKVLLFCTERCQNELGEKIGAELRNCVVTTYSAITPNPTAQDITKAVVGIQETPDAIIAIGGGSVIDFAKLYRAASDNNINIEQYFKAPTPLIRTTPLVAIPTTAGTGSEATRFAVVYINGEKYSLDAAAVMPDYALVDSQLMASAPAYLKATCGMDALCQAIEGFWARGATPQSDIFALEAIKLCRDALIDFVNSCNDESATSMAKASYLAGKCISITRTTAAHALSYKITQEYGIPHGHAVALSLPGLAELHYNNSEVNSPLRDKMLKLAELLGIKNGEFRNWFAELYHKIGLTYSTEELHIAPLQEIACAVNTERLANNPLPLTTAQLQQVFFP
ncbi:MAG: phosphonopyruvate decarboxylase [Akkermansia sp.]|nr:phosphonopyruvate decarboxylase [Akkermansia sp.]